MKTRILLVWEKPPLRPLMTPVVSSTCSRPLDLGAWKRAESEGAQIGIIRAQWGWQAGQPANHVAKHFAWQTMLPVLFTQRLEFAFKIENFLQTGGRQWECHVMSQ